MTAVDHDDNPLAGLFQVSTAREASVQAQEGPQEPPTAESQGEGAPEQIDALAVVFNQSPEVAAPARPEGPREPAAASEDDEAFSDASAKAAALVDFELVLEAEIGLAAAAWRNRRVQPLRSAAVAAPTQMQEIRNTLARAESDLALATARLEAAHRHAVPSLPLIDALLAGGEIERDALLRQRAAAAQMQLGSCMETIAGAGRSAQAELFDALNHAEARLAGVLALLDPQGQAQAPFRRRGFEWEADELRCIVAGLQVLRGQQKGA